MDSDETLGEHVLQVPAIRPLAIRWHGRGGFGTKTAAALLAELVINTGGYAQAAPEFGPERRGAPVQAFTRIGPEPIRRRGPIDSPDALVVLDARLLALPVTTSGVDTHTWVLVNAVSPVHVPPGLVVTLDASRIARQTLGRDIPNIPMLAGVVTLFLPIERTAFLSWLQQRLAGEFRPEIVTANLNAAELAMEVVHVRTSPLATA